MKKNVSVSLLLMIALAALLQICCIIATSVTWKQMQSWKILLDLISEAPNKSNSERNFARITSLQMKEQENVLLTGLGLSAVIIGLLIFRGGILCMIIFAKKDVQGNRVTKTFRRPYEEIKAIFNRNMIGEKDEKEKAFKSNAKDSLNQDEKINESNCNGDAQGNRLTRFLKKPYEGIKAIFTISKKGEEEDNEKIKEN